jgi:ketopantoate reductase
MDFNFGFTGTRHGMTDAQKVALRNFLDGGTGHFHHGDCIGADSEAHDIADECGYAIVLHPPSNYQNRAWRKVPAHMMKSELPYMMRNREIVNDTVALIATPAEMDEQPRGGTWSTVRFAKKLGKSVVLILPDGSIKQSMRTEMAAA